MGCVCSKDDDDNAPTEGADTATSPAQAPAEGVPPENESLLAAQQPTAAAAADEEKAAEAADADVDADAAEAARKAQLAEQLNSIRSGETAVTMRTVGPVEMAASESAADGEARRTALKLELDAIRSGEAPALAPTTETHAASDSNDTTTTTDTAADGEERRTALKTELEAIRRMSSDASLPLVIIRSGEGPDGLEGPGPAALDRNVTAPAPEVQRDDDDDLQEDQSVQLPKIQKVNFQQRGATL